MTTKPLVHWALQRKYKVRYTHRDDDEVRGVMTTPSGETLAFRFSPKERRLTVGEQPAVSLNEHGWEVDAQGAVVFRSKW